MMKKKILELKVCGMRERDNILAVAQLLPDYMGFIFYKQSPRFVGQEFEIPALPASVKKVGVFVNESSGEMLRLAERHRLDFLQLHGSESPRQVKALKKEGIGIIKVFSVEDNFDFALTESYQDDVDLFLFDTKGKYPGGNARRFNWQLLGKYNQAVPFLLSGGIGPAEIADVFSLAGFNIRGVDVNSGVELSPALKDPAKVTRVQEEIAK